MVREMRKVVLTVAEVTAAIDSYKRTKFEFLPPGKIGHCNLKLGFPATVDVEMMKANKVQVAEFNLEAPVLLEPLIRFCLQHNIVLPRNSRKSALICVDEAALYIQINTHDTM